MHQVARLLNVIALVWLIGWIVHFGLGSYLPYPVELALLPWSLPTSWGGISERAWEYVTFVPAPLLFAIGQSFGPKKRR